MELIKDVKVIPGRNEHGRIKDIIKDIVEMVFHYNDNWGTTSPVREIRVSVQQWVIAWRKKVVGDVFKPSLEKKKVRQGKISP